MPKQPTDARMSEQPSRPETPKEIRPTFSGQDVRQGEIVLRSRWQRWIFIAGLAGIVLLAFLLSFGT
jgi:hypothetical protein